MAQTANNTSSVRRAALERRRAMAQSGKAAIAGSRAAPASASDAGGSAAAPPAGGTGQDARSASRARRQAMASQGKAGLVSKDRTRSDSTASADTARAAAPAGPQASKDSDTGGGCGCGCKGRQAQSAEDIRTGTENTRSTESTGGASESRRSTARIRAAVRNANPQGAGRAASLARRKSMAARGKAGVSSQGLTPAQTARAANPQMSGRELAQTLREQRSRRGAAGQKSSESAGRIRRRRCNGAAAAEDAPWKVGASETADGQTVTGTMVGRSEKTTGDEASTCRPVTGTEYMGADIFRQFCQTDPQPSPMKIGVSQTGHGQKVSGSRIGRGEQVTGNEPGSCKRVTGNEYLGAEHSEKYCGTRAEAAPTRITGTETRKGKSVTGNNVGRSGKVTGDETGSGRELTGSQYMMPGQKTDMGRAPAKVGKSETLRGGSMTGTQVGRSERVTGDEPGSCRNVTGDDYLGREQFKQFCDSTPKPEDRKVGESGTLGGEHVTGTMTGRGGRVTGNEPGTCKTVTGTPYAGVEQYQTHCSPEQGAMAMARSRPHRGTPGAVMTGQQPAVGGTLTGDSRGACESLTGTPYVGADQFAKVCPATAAEPGQGDFPQALDTGNAPWGQFSVAAPAQTGTSATTDGSVTGTRYEQGRITGPFGMAGGRVTGTEEFRFGPGRNAQEAPARPMTEATLSPSPSRVTGEGMELANRITGDDWDRGDRVTGTEGMSATRRNPTRRGGSMESMAQARVQPEEKAPAEVPMSRVTGSSGNTDKGAMVTYSGGARG